MFGQENVLYACKEHEQVQRRQYQHNVLVHQNKNSCCHGVGIGTGSLDQGIDNCIRKEEIKTRHAAQLKEEEFSD